MLSTLSALGDLGITQPWWLLAALGAVFVLAAARTGATLPGDWVRAIESSLHAFQTMRLPHQPLPWQRVWVALCWLLLALAMSGINYGQAQAPNIRNLIGRVIVIDMGLANTSRLLVQSARDLIAASPEIPTAVVATGAQAFDVVPLTSDSAHLDRYLRVLTPEVLPATGHFPLTGLARAQAILERSLTHVGQVLVYTSLPATEAPADVGTHAPASAQSANTATFLVLPDDVSEARDGWQATAAQLSATIVTTGQIDALQNDMTRRRNAAATRLASVRERQDLTALFVVLTMICWLWLFFRRPPA